MSTPPDGDVALLQSRFYCWSFPGAPIKVELDLDIVDQIRKEIDAISAGDPQTSGGGLLLGEVRSGTVVISDCRTVEGASAAAFEAAVLQHKLAGAGAGVVGFYRIEPGEALRLKPEDADIARKVFPTPNSVVLLAQPRPHNLPVATFFFWEEGQILGEFAFLEFPFDSQLLDIERRGKQVRQAPEPEIEIAAQPPGLRWRVRIPIRAVAWAGAVVALSALGASAVWVFSSSRSPSRSAAPAVSSKPAPSFGLRAERSGTDFVLTWDRTSPLVTSALWGLLSIDDRNGRRDISLQTDQLRTGSILYQPTSDEIRFRLSLIAPDQHIETESVTVIRAASGGPAVKPGSRSRATPAGRPLTGIPRGSPDPVSTAPAASEVQSGPAEAQEPVENRKTPAAPEPGSPAPPGAVALSMPAGPLFKIRATRAVQLSDLPGHLAAQ